ncbi:hypothetical protein B0T19DRAFT_259591 [Cercophora scortea]|uniref:Uncharacterized protein n=1 Tax=Cercophora scortea TaxID=314031 RepID=A0AAE0I9V4_9PEZI|nr:hypothetical protein B0T19DRAFT_259591 [Cercophora scortea]
MSLEPRKWCQLGVCTGRLSAGIEQVSGDGRGFRYDNDAARYGSDFRLLTLAVVVSGVVGDLGDGIRTGLTAWLAWGSLLQLVFCCFCVCISILGITEDAARSQLSFCLFLFLLGAFVFLFAFV